MAGYKKFFVNAVTKAYPGKAVALMAAVEEHNSIIAADTSFAKTSANPVDRRLDFSAYFLALIKVLDEEGERYENIRTVCLDVVLNYVQPKNKLHAMLKRLPPMLLRTPLGSVITKAFNKKVSRNANPAGFIANVITSKQETYGFGYGIDIIECGICKLFKKHNYLKYATILCEVDEVTSNLAGLTLIRTGTIATGAKKCDFRYKRNQ